MGSAAGTFVNYAKSSVALGGTFGTAIASPAFKRARITSDGLKGNYKVEKSRELVNSFRTKNFRRLGLDAGGALGSEFIFGNLDDWLESLLYSTWQRTAQRYNATADTQITDVAAGTGVFTILAASAGDENRVGTFAVGHLVRTTAFTNAGNNALKRVTAASATSFTVATAGLVNEAAPPLGARAKAVGIEAPANGNISVTTSGLGAGEVAIINASGIDFAALGIVAGMWFKASVFPTAADNGWYRALNVTATRIGCDRAPVGVATDAAASVQVRLWLPDYIRDGTSAIVWFDFERQLPQLATPEYHYFISMMAKSWSLGLTPQGIVTCSVGFIGSKKSTGTARVASPTDVTADALGAIPRVGEMFDASNNVARVALNGTPLVDVVTDCSWQIDNNASGLPAVGNLGAGRLQRPAWNPVLTLRSYYDSRSLLANIEADTVFGVESILTDPLGTRAFIMDYPSAKTLSGDLNDIVADGELDLPLSIGGIENTTFGCQVQYMRFEEYA